MNFESFYSHQFPKNRFKIPKKRVLFNSFLWFLFWMFLYGAIVLIKPELILIVMAFNLPLSTFFCLGIIFNFLCVLIFNYPYYLDILFKLLVIVFTFSLTVIYRQILFPEPKSFQQKIKSRFKEFIFWFIPWVIILSILSFLVAMTM